MCVSEYPGNFVVVAVDGMGWVVVLDLVIIITRLSEVVSDYRRRLWSYLKLEFALEVAGNSVR